MPIEALHWALLTFHFTLKVFTFRYAELGFCACKTRSVELETATQHPEDGVGVFRKKWRFCFCFGIGSALLSYLPTAGGEAQTFLLADARRVRSRMVICF